jgi:N-acetylmuramoyl-L-alanine amidase
MSLPIKSILAVCILSGAFAGPAFSIYNAAPMPPAGNRPATPVIIDAGHGGDDLGAVVKGVREKDIALAVSLKLRNKLKNDLPVALTREDDNYVTLDSRIIESVDWNGAIFVSIHLNKVKDKRLNGAVVYSYGADRLKRVKRRPHHKGVPPMPAPPGVQAKEGAYLAAAVAKSMRGDGFRVEESQSDYYVLKSPAEPSILIEIGYLSNPEEAAHLVDGAYQNKIVDALARAILAYANDRALRSGAMVR